MKTSNSHDDIVIAALSFAKKRSLDGNSFSHSDLKEHLTKMGFKTDGEHAHFIAELNNEMHPKSWNSSKVNSFISLDAYLGLLDYEELQQARQDAKDAKKTASIAIWLNIISTVLAAIIGILQLVSCTPSKKQETKNEIVPISGNSYRIARNKDSIVLTGPAPFHFGIQVYREKKKILDYTDKELQINSTDSDGNDSNWFTEHWGQNENLYIITVFGAPGPDQFLILKVTDSNTTVLGKTEPSSAEIFGDIDRDGKFEIGGISMYCQGGDSTCHSVDYYRVFEIAENFPTDIALTNYFKKSFDKK